MDASVGFLIENLKELVRYHLTLKDKSDIKIKCYAKSDQDRLNEDLSNLKAILEGASGKFEKDEVFKQMGRHVRETIYDIEDIIDTCVTEAVAGKSRRSNWLNKVCCNGVDIDLAEEVRTIRVQKVMPLMDRSQRLVSYSSDFDMVGYMARQIRKKKCKHIVGFEDETKLFVDQLTRESDELEITSIIGMPGLGKTTLAWNIFEHQTIRDKFPIRIWVDVSHEDLNMRNVLLQILSEFTSKPDESLKDEQLLSDVKGHLEHGKFFIVMDDMWTTDAWKQLKALLPTENEYSRVLITTRNRDVGIHASTSTQQAHDLRFLSEKESWDLLQYEVYGQLNVVPPELVVVGKSIAVDCMGLPLSIMAVGQILIDIISCASGDGSAIRNEWEKVSKCVTTYLVEGCRNSLLGSIISLSYNTLPYELKMCFLYLGVFPEDAEIPVKKLFRLWIAEGFIHDTGRMLLEEVAHDYLKELINRNLVMVTGTNFCGEAKTCQLHVSIRGICKSEAGHMNLFQEINKSESAENVKKCRRLCVHSDAFHLFSLIRKLELQKARSFLCFDESREAIDMPNFTDAFSSLRVYDAKSVKFPIFSPKAVQQLNHLRYLTLTLDSESNILPEAVTNIWNLQTIIVDTRSKTLKIEGDMLKMGNLRHVKTRASIVMETKAGGKGSVNLQTLSRLSPESCTLEVCKKARSLISLAIQGDLRTFGHSKCLKELDSLNKLKFVHEVSPGGAAENPLRCLPDRFPPKLTILVLRGTHLDWSRMYICSQICTLEVLKLKDNAFQGNVWETSGNGFINLICLDINRADLQRWTARNDDFPELRFLHIKNCGKILEIPSSIGKKLEVLSLERVTADAVICAKKIVEEQRSAERVIRLDIAPADERL